MKSDSELQFKENTFIVPFLFVFLIWFIYWLEINFDWNFNKYGLYPRTFKGLRGVLFAPFIHSDTNHLFNNSIPLFVLATSLFYFYRDVALRVLLIGFVLTGFFTWLIARESYHIGASGIVYLLFSFVFFSGIIKKHYRLVATSLVVIFLYGSMVWYILPIKTNISWEGHLSGFLMGFILAILYRKKGIVKEKFIFSKTDFDNQFDEYGNYIPPETTEENLSTNENPIETEKKPVQEIKYKYIYKEKD